MTSRVVKVQNMDIEIRDMDVKRVQAVLDGKLNPKWVSTEEIQAINDKLYDVMAARLQTHYGVLSIQ